MTDTGNLTWIELAGLPLESKVEVTVRGRLIQRESIFNSMQLYVQPANGNLICVESVEYGRLLLQPLKVGDSVPKARLYELPHGSVIRGASLVYENIGGHWYTPGSSVAKYLSAEVYLLLFLPEKSN